MVADIEELDQMDASETHARRLNAKEVFNAHENEKTVFPVADGTIKISGEDQDLRTSTLIRDSPDRGEEQHNLRGELGGLSSPPHIKMTQHEMMRKLKMISCLLQEISFIAIMWNPESNCTCRKKNHFLFQ